MENDVVNFFKLFIEKLLKKSVIMTFLMATLLVFTPNRVGEI